METRSWKNCSRVLKFLSWKKPPMGGILVHVRSSEAERKLVRQEVVLLGRKFKIKRQSPFVNKFYLDIFGVGSTNTANELFMGLAALGAMPMFLTPRDVNMDAHVATPTWRFYFGQEEPPSCLMVRGFITNQLVHGRKMYTTRGRRSLAPPERAVSFKRSPYAVILPSGSSSPRNVSSLSAELHGETTRSNNTATSRQTSVSPETEDENIRDQDRSNLRGEHPRPAEMNGARQSLIRQSTGATPVEPHTDAQIVVSVDQTDFDMNSVPSDDDVDMVGQMESGFKRPEPSFADANPYAALDMLDCAFDAFEPKTISEEVPGVLMIPRLTSVPAANVQDEQGPLPTKRRSLNFENPASRKLKPKEDVLVTAQETELESHEDRVVQSMQHLDPVKALLHQSKNMDEIVKSIKSMPVAWSTALCSDLASGSKNMEEITSLHLLDRVLAKQAEKGIIVSFHQRVIASHLPLGKTRKNCVEFLTSVLGQQPTQVQNEWEILRLLSAFELLAMAACPFLFGSPEWLAYLVGEKNEEMIPHSHQSLLPDNVLLKLLRSRLGHQLLTKLKEKLPTCAFLDAINALSSSNLAPAGLPVLTLQCLSPIEETASSN